MVLICVCLGVDWGKAEMGGTVEFYIKYSSLFSHFVHWFWCRFSEPSQPGQWEGSFLCSSELIEPSTPSALDSLMLLLMLFHSFPGKRRVYDI